MEFEWDDSKNIYLVEKGRPSFDTISYKIGTGFLLAVVENPSAKYPGQKFMVVQVERKIWSVAFEKKSKVFRLITVLHNKEIESHYKGEMR